LTYKVGSVWPDGNLETLLLHSIFPKCMLNCVVVLLGGRVNRVIYDDTHQWFLGSCVKFNQTAVVVLKNSFRN